MACMHTQDNCTLYVIASNKDRKARGEKLKTRSM